MEDTMPFRYTSIPDDDLIVDLGDGIPDTDSWGNPSEPDPPQGPVPPLEFWGTELPF